MVLVITAVVAATSACDDNGWKQTAPFAPSLRPAFGARVTDDKLGLWMGSPCVRTTSIDLTFDAYQGNRAQLTLSAPGGVDGPGVDVEYLVLGGPYPGLDVTGALPAGFDWRKAESARVIVDGPPVSWGSTTNIAEIVKGSAEHPDDMYWFQDVGWLNPAQVAEQDGKTFLTTCTPDPTKK
jgi:hypothetical protein